MKLDFSAVSSASVFRKEKNAYSVDPLV